MLGSLTTFDHWDLQASGPLAAWLAANPNELSLAAPMPHWLDLVRLAQARLAQGLHRGAVSTALAEVRHLAVLAYSTETLMGEMVAVSLLKYEREAAERAVATGLDTGGWAPVSAADAETLRAVLLTMVAVYDLHTPTDVADSFGPGLGACAALAENVDITALVRPLFDPPGVFGNRYIGRFDALGTRLAAAPCRLTRARAVWANPDWARAQLDGMLAEDFGEKELSSLPFWRELVGEQLLSVAMPAYGGAYGR